MSADALDDTTADACGTGGCDDCVFGCLPGPTTTCGGDGGSASAEDRATLAASGVVIAVLAAVLAVTGSGWPAWVAAAAGLAGVVLAGGGLVALRRGGPLGDRLLAGGTTLLPFATGTLLMALLARVVTTILS